MKLNRGALKLYKTLRGLARRYGFAFAGQEWLADLFDVCRQTVAKWIRQLIAHGLIEVQRRYHTSTAYRIVRPLQDVQHRQLTLTRCGPYSTSSKDSTPSGEQTPQLVSEVAQYFGDTKLAGKRADSALISRVARLVRDQSGFERFKSYWARWLKRNRPEGWGIFITLAEDAGRNQTPTIPSPQPIPQKPPILPQPPIIPAVQRIPVQTERTLLAGLGVNPDQFTFRRR